MINKGKRLLALEKRILMVEQELEKISKNLNSSHRVANIPSSEEDLSYKEVLDEWLNGKKK